MFKLPTVAAALIVAAFAAAPGTASASNCTPQQGQAFIDSGRYDRAVREFTCVIGADPTGVEGYRGRIEAKLLLGRYSDAMRDAARITAVVVPVHPDAYDSIFAGYESRLASDPDDVAALTGASFTHWWSFDYVSALHLLDHLLDLRPDDLYGNLYRGSNRLLRGVSTKQGVADLERAIVMAPTSADVRFIVADAYTYGQPDPQRAFDEAMLALNWGLDTPRVHAILAVSQMAFGDAAAAAAEIETHIDLVTTDLIATSPLAGGGSMALDLVAGRTFEIPVEAVAGQTISITTSSPDFWDSIAVLLAPDGTPVVGSDDANDYFAAFDFVAPATGTYRLYVTSFEGVSSGELVVTRA